MTKDRPEICLFPYYFFRHFEEEDAWSRLGWRTIPRQKVSTPSIKSKRIYVSGFSALGKLRRRFHRLLETVDEPRQLTPLSRLSVSLSTLLSLLSETRSNGTALRNWNGETFQSDRVPATPFVEAFFFFSSSSWFLWRRIN